MMVRSADGRFAAGRQAPDSTAAVRSRRYVSVDLAPTLLDLAGIEADDPIDGRSLAPLLRGQTPADWRKSLLIEYTTDTVFPRVLDMGYRAVRTQRWKLIRYNTLQGMDELYDLLHDPYEISNVFSRPDLQAVVQRGQHALLLPSLERPRGIGLLARQRAPQPQGGQHHDGAQAGRDEERQVVALPGSAGT